MCSTLHDHDTSLTMASNKNQVKECERVTDLLTLENNSFVRIKNMVDLPSANFNLHSLKLLATNRMETLFTDTMTIIKKYRKYNC